MSKFNHIITYIIVQIMMSLFANRSINERFKFLKQLLYPRYASARFTNIIPVCQYIPYKIQSTAEGSLRIDASVRGRIEKTCPLGSVFGFTRTATLLTDFALRPHTHG